MLCITLGRTQLPGEFAERLQFRKLEQDLAAQLAALESMKSDSGLQAEMQFESKLRGLLAEYGYSLRDVINLLDPTAAKRGKSAPLSAPAEKGTRKARSLKVYKNPHSGEIVETKGGNHKLLKAWKNEHGSDVVESWLSK
ncbi:histone-like nucleoid-structuring protein, MvaT/MvaU family [Pseudomonas lurida]|uniref:histone-like nucleoid-structuring protein, MvaT/MvaU family n=1 Tax=Pseudomonas lurida TaxID=244566 RepID=UPI00241078F4|nr:histone-like nucleoid-structuring protein, MvaT/MvaU family [Pseudomonas lurida]